MVLNIWQGSYCIIGNEIHRFIIFHFLKFNKMLDHFFIIIHSSSVFRYTNTRRIIRRVFKQYCPPPQPICERYSFNSFCSIVFFVCCIIFCNFARSIFFHIVSVRIAEPPPPLVGVLCLVGRWFVMLQYCNMTREHPHANPVVMRSGQRAVPRSGICVGVPACNASATRQHT